MDFYSFAYTYPYFYQDWRLFAPCPQNNVDVFIRYKVKDQCFYTEAISDLKSTRNLFTGQEFILLSLSGSAGFIEHEEKEITKDLYCIKLNKNYFILKQSLTAYLTNKHLKNITGLSIIIRVKNHKDKKTKYLLDQ